MSTGSSGLTVTDVRRSRLRVSVSPEFWSTAKRESKTHTLFAEDKKFHSCSSLNKDFLVILCPSTRFSFTKSSYKSRNFVSVVLSRRGSWTRGQQYHCSRGWVGGTGRLSVVSIPPWSQRGLLGPEGKTLRTKTRVVGPCGPVG